MAGKSMKSSVKGALAGVIMTGGWLLADLLLPEPWGDVVLFGAMAVVNVGIGWKLGSLYDSHNGKETVSALDTQNPNQVEIRS